MLDEEPPTLVKMRSWSKKEKTNQSSGKMNKLPNFEKDCLLTDDPYLLSYLNMLSILMGVKAISLELSPDLRLGVDAPLLCAVFGCLILYVAFSVILVVLYVSCTKRENLIIKAIVELLTIMLCSSMFILLTIGVLKVGLDPGRLDLGDTKLYCLYCMLTYLICIFKLIVGVAWYLRPTSLDLPEQNGVPKNGPLRTMGSPTKPASCNSRNSKVPTETNKGSNTEDKDVGNSNSVEQSPRIVDMPLCNGPVVKRLCEGRTQIVSDYLAFKRFPPSEESSIDFPLSPSPEKLSSFEHTPAKSDKQISHMTSLEYDEKEHKPEGAFNLLLDDRVPYEPSAKCGEPLLRAFRQSRYFANLSPSSCSSDDVIRLPPSPKVYSPPKEYSDSSSDDLQEPERISFRQFLMEQYPRYIRK